jgi:DNA-binding FadR family transcriptional regulator
MLTPPKPLRLSEQVESRLEEMIVSGEFPLGARVPGERELMKRLEVSRPIVREAIKRLESRGLLRVYPSRGTFITGTPEWGIRAQWQSWVAKDRDKLLAVNEVRKLLEGGAAGLAATRGSQHDLAELRLAHYAFEQQVARGGSVADVSHWDKVFHHQLAVASGNEVLASFVQNLNSTVSAQRRSLFANRTTAERSCREHERILEAVESGSPEAARAAVCDHIDRVLSDIDQLTHPADLEAVVR